MTDCTTSTHKRPDHPATRTLLYEIKDHVNSLKLKLMRIMKPSKNRESYVADLVRLSELIKKL